MTVFDRPIERTVRPATAPVAGDQLDFRPNKGGGWLIRSLRFVFTASGVAGNRTIVFEASDGTDIYLTTAAQAVLAAAGSSVYCAFAGIPPRASAVGYIAIDWPTDGLWLPQGHRLRTTVLSGDAGDLFEDVTMRVVEYPSGPTNTKFPYGPGIFSPTDQD